jgi:hypothetical protein
MNVPEQDAAEVLHMPADARKLSNFRPLQMRVCDKNRVHKCVHLGKSGASITNEITL